MSDKYLNTVGEFEGVALKPSGGWLSKSREKGTPCVQILLRVVNDPDCDGQLITWNGWLSDKAFYNTVHKLKEVFGFNGDFDDLIRGKTTFDGQPCRFTTDAEEYQGKSRVKVKWLNAVDYAPGAPALEEAELKTLSASFSRRAKAALAETKESGPAPNPPTDGDDVPF